MIYLTLFLTFFKIGLFTFGGGYAMLPLIQEEVLKNAWLTNTQILNFVAVSESTPGPFAINMATYVGTECAGILGAVSATLGVVMPSFIIILIVAHFYERFKASRVVSGLMSGLRPAAIGLIAAAVVSLAITIFVGGTSVGDAVVTVRFWLSLVIFGTMFYLAVKRKVHPIIIIAISAACGVAAGYAGLL